MGDRLAYADTGQTRELQARIAELEKKCEMLSDALYNEEEDARGYYEREARMLARIARLRAVVYAVACGRTVEATTNEFDYQAHMVWGESEHEVGEALRRLQPGDLEDSDGAQTGN